MGNSYQVELTSVTEASENISEKVFSDLSIEVPLVYLEDYLVIEKCLTSIWNRFFEVLARLKKCASEIEECRCIFFEERIHFWFMLFKKKRMTLIKNVDSNKKRDPKPIRVMYKEIGKVDFNQTSITLAHNDEKKRCFYRKRSCRNMIPEKWKNCLHPKLTRELRRKHSTNGSIIDWYCCNFDTKTRTGWPSWYMC